MDIRLHGIKKDSTVDGTGIRYAVFVQGCPHKCKGCHNLDSWDADGGEKVKLTKLFSEIKALPKEYAGVTFSGGEPFTQAALLSPLALLTKSINKTVWCYTGYTFEEILQMGEQEKQLLSHIDVLVDGPFIEEQKNELLQFKGSANQRIINVPASLREEQVVLL